MPRELDAFSPEELLVELRLREEQDSDGNQLDADEGGAPAGAGQEDLYRGTALIGRQLTPAGLDRALVRLNRRVQNHRPAPIRRLRRIGILVRSERDFRQQGNCQVSLVCPTTGCRGEDVTRITKLASRIPRP
jgi:hypothetical protein